jgi:hypothetical protein
MRICITSAVFIASVLVFGDQSSMAETHEETVRGSYVTVEPLLGKSPRPIRVFLSTTERRTLLQLEAETSKVKDRRYFDDSLVRWHIEPSARLSPTMLLQRRVYHSLRKMLEGADGVTARWPVDIVIGRTQTYILGTLKALGCEPNLTSQGGQILMGAAVCGRRIIVSNVSGYLFLTKPGQRVTPRMEQLTEKPLFTSSYKIVARNSSALAHEWMHIYRAAGREGFVAVDEPLWFKEGFAEIWAYIAQIRMLQKPNGFLRMHVTRLRNFSNWARDCPGPLSRYQSSGSAAGCEYHLGSLAMEYLIANYGGLEKTSWWFRVDNGRWPFAVDFGALFGVPLEQFEAEANRYIEIVRAAERRS